MGGQRSGVDISYYNDSDKQQSISPWSVRKTPKYQAELLHHQQFLKLKQKYQALRNKLFLRKKNLKKMMTILRYSEYVEFRRGLSLTD